MQTQVFLEFTDNTEEHWEIYSSKTNVPTPIYVCYSPLQADTQHTATESPYWH